MFIVYLDEAGQAGGFDSSTNKLADNTSKYFTLAGFMIDGDDIIQIENGLKSIKKRYNLSIEHEIKWHTTYSKYGLTYEQYEEMRKEIISFISNYKKSVVGIVVDKESCYKNKEFISTQEDLYAVALHLLMERYCMETTNYKLKSQKPTMFIADSRKNNKNDRLDLQVKVAYRRAKNMGTHFLKFPTFAENIVFVDSDEFVGVQLADYCAGVIHKKYEKNDDKYFDLLKPAIVTKANNIYGPGIKLYK